jgi:alpha-tubulin suppressor-like RCC1 family protein
LSPKPIEALCGVRVPSVAAADNRSYAVADTGELWAWGYNDDFLPPLGLDDDEQLIYHLPKLVESLPGIKVDAVAADEHETLALTGDGSVYAWGNKVAARMGALGLDP